MENNEFLHTQIMGCGLRIKIFNFTSQICDLFVLFFQFFIENVH
eukprot:UN18584